LSTNIKADGFVKSPTSAFCCVLRHCGVLLCTPRSSEFARLELGTFYFAIFSKTFCGFIKEDEQKKGAKTRKKNHRIYDPTGRNLPSGDKDIAPFKYWRALGF
jgi:hypothetical protein